MRREKTGSKTNIVLKIGAALAAVGLLTFSHTLTSLGALIVLACLAIELVGWLTTLSTQTWVAIIRATDATGSVIAFYGWWLSAEVGIVFGAIILTVARTMALAGWLLSRGWRSTSEQHRQDLELALEEMKAHLGWRLTLRRFQRVGAGVQAALLVFDIAVPLARALNLIGNLIFLIGWIIGEVRGLATWVMGQSLGLT